MILNWKWTRRDYDRLREYEEDLYKKTHMTKEESRKIEPDFDEVLEYGFHPIFDLDYEKRQFTTLELNDHIRRTTGRKEKLRLPISKKLKIELVKERGGICQHCNEEVYQHIHHIDSDPGNNDKTNLLLVCFNCHKDIEEKIKRKRARI